MLALVEEHIDELVGRIVDRAAEFYAEQGDWLPVPPEDLAANAVALTRTALTAIGAGRGPTDEELAIAAMLGERRARQGVSLESVLRGLRAGAREAMITVQHTATVSGLGAVETIDLTTALWDWIDDVSVVVAEAHRRVEVSRARSDEQQRASFVHGLVRGTLDPRLAAERAPAFGLDPDAELVVLCVRPRDGAERDQIIAQLLPRTWSPGVAADVDHDLVAILPRAPETELQAPAGLGAAAALGGLPRSYREAARAVAAAATAQITGVRRLDELAFEAADGRLGELLAARLVDPVRGLGAFGDELLASLRVYAAHDQNVDAAARELHVHPNTLRHRLSRYEETVGVSLRNVRDLAEIWWALTYVGESPTERRPGA